MRIRVATLFIAIGVLCSTASKREEHAARAAELLGGEVFNGSEKTDDEGNKFRLIGCDADDKDCLSRNELVTKLGCDWLKEDCSGCSTLDLACLTEAGK